jgi:moderate conductance mechanosensitive channel
VPYGSLGRVRNNSRDWVIDKFEIPLPVSVDGEKARKLVKKIGVEMLEDPEFANIIDMPLKAKLYRIDPGIKVLAVRCRRRRASSSRSAARPIGGSRRPSRRMGSSSPTRARG